MGSIYPKPAWPNVGYDCWYEQVDPDDTKDLQFMGYRTWLVMCGRQRTTVTAKTLDAAKEMACKNRGWDWHKVTLVRPLWRSEVIKNNVR
jgi:hypothetical protein